MGLLSRGSRVRVAAGAPFLKEFADFAPKKNVGRTSIEHSDQSGEFAPTSPDFTIRQGVLLTCARSSIQQISPEAGQLEHVAEVCRPIGLGVRDEVGHQQTNGRVAAQMLG